MLYMQRGISKRAVTLLDWTYMVSTTSMIARESRMPRLKKAGPAVPAVKAVMFKFAENQTKNS
jgi:hypothetical protein